MGTLRNWVKKNTSERVYLWLTNLNLRRKGSALLLSRHSNGPLHVAHGSEGIYIAREARVGRYSNGVLNRCNELARQYHLDKISVHQGDVFVDCGANIGELGLWAKLNGMAYHAIEPEELEATCCDLNNFDGEDRTARVALWHEDGDLTFYSSPDDADGSVIRPASYVEERVVRAVTLSTLAGIWGVQRIKVLKLEAEGAEPEILLGASAMLSEIEYVAADCGYERGEKQEHTFVEVDRVLRRAGFELLYADFKRVTVLYRNTRW